MKDQGQHRYPHSMAPQRGFTLVELIAVLVLTGILAAVAMPRFMDRAPFDSVAFNDQMATMLRYAQKVAIAQNRNVHVRITAARVALCYDAACSVGNRVQAPGGSSSRSNATMAACNDGAWACEAPPPQVTISTVASFYYDPLGKPFAATDASTASVSTFVAPLVLTVRANASVRSITVEPETGYVH